jgi:predicted XRE-type DNA-binding protein
VEVSDPMTGIREARAALEDAEDKARKLVTAARLKLAQEILKARTNDVPQKDIAAELDLTREQVRRLQKMAADSAGS